MRLKVDNFLVPFHFLRVCKFRAASPGRTPAVQDVRYAVRLFPRRLSGVAKRGPRRAESATRFSPGETVYTIAPIL